MTFDFYYYQREDIYNCSHFQTILRSSKEYAREYWNSCKNWWMIYRAIWKKLEIGSITVYIRLPILWDTSYIEFHFFFPPTLNRFQSRGNYESKKKKGTWSSGTWIREARKLERSVYIDRATWAEKYSYKILLCNRTRVLQGWNRGARNLYNSSRGWILVVASPRNL